MCLCTVNHMCLCSHAGLQMAFDSHPLFNTDHQMYDTMQIVGDKICFYSFQLVARDLLYAPSHRQESTYHGLC